MAQQLAPGRHPDVLADGDQVRSGIIDKDTPRDSRTFSDMDTPEAMNSRRNMCRESERRNDGPETDPDALDD